MATVKGIQSGTISVASNPLSTTQVVTATLTSVVPGSTLLLMSADFQSNGTSLSINDLSFTAELTNSTTATFSRTSNSSQAQSAATIKWYAIEWNSGVTVQRGISLMNATTVNATLSPAISLTTAVPIITYRLGASSTYTGKNHIRAKLTTTTNLALTMNVLSSAGQCAWQVVDFGSNATVQTGDVTFLSTDTSLAQTITAVDPTTSAVFLSYEVGAGTATGQAGDKLIRADLGTGGTTTALTIVRELANGSTPKVTYYVVTFSDGTTVQQATQAFATTDGTLTPALSPSLDTTLSVAYLAGYAQQQGTANSTGYAQSVATFLADLGAGTATTVSLQRGTGIATAANARWTTILFQAAAASAPFPPFPPPQLPHYRM